MDIDADVKGDAYEGLLEKNAADVKGGAGRIRTDRRRFKKILVFEPSIPLSAAWVPRNFSHLRCL